MPQPASHGCCARSARDNVGGRGQSISTIAAPSEPVVPAPVAPGAASLISIFCRRRALPLARFPSRASPRALPCLRASAARIFCGLKTSATLQPRLRYVNFVGTLNPGRLQHSPTGTVCRRCVVCGIRRAPSVHVALRPTLCPVPKVGPAGGVYTR